MHTPADIKRIDGRSVMLHQSAGQLRAEILSPEAAVFDFMDAQPLPASPHPERQPDHKAKNNNMKMLALHLKDIKETRIAILLTPMTTERPPQPVKLSALSEW